MSIPTHNIQYYNGDTYKLLVEFYKADGTPITLATGEVAAAIVSNPDSPLTSHVTDFNVTVSGSTATLSILPSMASALAPGNTYYYDVQYTKTPVGGVILERYTFFKGAIEVEGGIT